MVRVKRRVSTVFFLSRKGFAAQLSECVAAAKVTRLKQSKGFKLEEK